LGWQFEIGIKFHNYRKGFCKIKGLGVWLRFFVRFSCFTVKASGFIFCPKTLTLRFEKSIEES